MPVPPMFAAPFKAFLDRYSFQLIVVLLLYYLFRGVLWRGVNFVSGKMELNLLPLLNTIEELYEVFVIAIITLFFIDELIESLHGIVIFTRTNRYIFITFIAFSVLRLTYSMYTKNSTYWYYTNKKYTQFFDVDGKRISRDDKVVYNQKIYQVFSIKHEDFENRFEPIEWCLAEYSVSILKKVISLEEAVKDEKGHLKIYKFGMGEDH